MCRSSTFTSGAAKHKFSLTHEEFFFSKSSGFLTKSEFSILTFFETGKSFTTAKSVELEYEFGLTDSAGSTEVSHPFISIEMIWIGLDFC